MDGGSLAITTSAGKGIKVEGKEDTSTPLGFIAIGHIGNVFLGTDAAGRSRRLCCKLCSDSPTREYRQGNRKHDPRP